jgi:hypothetical protein
MKFSFTVKSDKGKKKKKPPRRGGRLVVIAVVGFATLWITQDPQAVAVVVAPLGVSAIA